MRREPNERTVQQADAADGLRPPLIGEALGLQTQMTKPPKVIIDKERVVHSYAELWHASACMLEAGIREAKGSSWQFLSSAVLTAFSFEAYLNHVGPRTIECWEGLERLPPWSKFKLLCETLSVTFPGGTGIRPLQTVDRLLRFRNTIAHGRSKELAVKGEQRSVDANVDAYLGEQLLADWEHLIETPDFAQRAREDVEKVLEELHAARRDEKEGLFTFGMSSGGASLIERPGLK